MEDGRTSMSHHSTTFVCESIFDCDNFRSLSRQSTGQQFTEILHFLLLDNKDPLILDQPEDNLDNALTADRNVIKLQNPKLKEQFLFATHNADIPDIGEAERIGVINVRDSKIDLPEEKQGSRGQLTLMEYEKLL